MQRRTDLLQDVDRGPQLVALARELVDAGAKRGDVRNLADGVVTGGERRVGDG
jgi:hypothetical protein